MTNDAPLPQFYAGTEIKTMFLINDINEGNRYKSDGLFSLYQRREISNFVSLCPPKGGNKGCFTEQLL